MMLSLESGLYVMEYERRFELQRAERLRKLGLVWEIERAGLDKPDWLRSLRSGLQRLLSRRTKAAAEGGPMAGPRPAIDA